VWSLVDREALYQLPGPKWSAHSCCPNPVLALDHDVTDVDLLTLLRMSNVNARVGLVARAVSYSDCYAAYIDQGILKITRLYLEEVRELAAVPHPTVETMPFRMRFHVWGVNPLRLAAKVWPDGGRQPSAWTATAEDRSATVRADGTGLHRLTHSRADDWQPDWGRGPSGLLEESSAGH
jgi:hypothetical protein